MVATASIEDGAPFWVTEPLLAGATVFILGGGPSLRGFDFSLLAGLRTIAVNQAALHVVEQDMLYFTDANWYEGNAELCRTWRGIAFTGSRAAKRMCPSLRRVLFNPGNTFEPGLVRQGRSSGHNATALAVTLGARLIVLLGFDMRTEGSRSHFHDKYRNNDGAMYAREFIPSFDGWDRGARALGVTILNATPGSALEEFRKVDLADVLERSAG